MKFRFQLVISLLFFSFYVQAQINLEKEYNTTIYFAELEGQFYYSLDYTDNQCNVYDLDHNFLKSIDIQAPTDWYFYDAAYLSQSVFNDDDQLELLVVFYRYIQDTDTSGHYEYYTQVINEGGSVLLDIPNGGYSTVYPDLNNKYKLLVYIYDFSDYVFVSQTNIYALPGVPPSIIKQNDTNLGEAYPNPANTKVHIPLKTSYVSPQSFIVLTDIQGREIIRKPLNNRKSEITLNTVNLRPGTYLYFLEQNGQRIPAKKIVVQ